VAADVRRLAKLVTGWALFSGIVGAFLVFVLGVVREEWRRDREAVGILRLLQAEIEHNITTAQTLEYWRYAEAVKIDMRILPRMKVEVWHDVRVRAAQLLPEALIQALNDYYSPLANVLTLSDLQEDPKNLDISNDVILNAIGKLRDPDYKAPPILYLDYAVLVLEAQNKVRDQVVDYLALRIWRRYPVTGWLIGFIAPLPVRTDGTEAR